MNLKKKNLEFNEYLDTVLFHTKRTELTPEKRLVRRKKADADDLEFCKIYFSKIFNLPYNDCHRHLARLTKGKYTISGFRKNGKSAFTYCAKVIKPMALGIGGIINVSCRTDDISKERTASLVRLLRRNSLLMYDYKIEIQQDLKGHYIINSTHLVASSVNQGLRNILDDNFKRIKISVNDDLYNRTTVDSDRDNEKVTAFVESEVYGQMEDDGLSITMGNSINANCPIVRLKEKHPEDHFSLPALDENDESTWPEYRTTADWVKFKNETPFDIWMGEYMDKPGLRGYNFDPAWRKVVNLNLVNIIASISACDPSYGQSPSACFKAIATVGATDKGEVVVQDMYLRKEQYPQLFDYMVELMPRIKNWKVLLFENDFNQWAFAQPYYSDWVKQTGKTIPILPFFSSQSQTEFRSADKESRILNLVHPHQTGQILYNDTIIKSHDFDVYWSQYLAFGKAKEKLDGLDALATAYIMVFRWIETGTFKPLKKKRFAPLRWFR